jgi:FtsP/CotA-like multicopper oxidase with cupredoxin domain
LYSGLLVIYLEDKRMVSRRDFLKVGAIGGSVGLIGWLGFKTMGDPLRMFSVGKVVAGLLGPKEIKKFQSALLIPPVMPSAGTIVSGSDEIDYYEISVRQFEQQILPQGMPKTTVWGYGAVKSADPNGLLLHNAPSLTIEATWNKPVRVKWINDLVDDQGNYLPHLLPVDPTLHWANPGGGTEGRDMRQPFAMTPERYTGPVPMVTHVHGAIGVGDESDGYAEAWFLPAANNIPANFARVGSWYDFLGVKAAAAQGELWKEGSATFQYPNQGRAATIWYHDHTVGMTRLNVYAGPAGFFIIRGGPDGDEALLDSRSNTPAFLPGPAPKPGDVFPSDKTYYEIPIAIQDRAFRQDGSLFYPDSREYFDEYKGPYIPKTDVSPIWNPEFFGNTIMVNGNTWPFQNVEQRRYRLRLLNGCQARFLILDFAGIPNVDVWQIGNEGGFLVEPVNISAGYGNQVLMSPAERADLIVDFTKVPLGSHILRNLGPDEPYGGGEPGKDFEPSDPETTGQMLEFRVIAISGVDESTPAQFLKTPVIADIKEALRIRRLALMEQMSVVHDGPAEAKLGVIAQDGSAAAFEWMDPVTENPGVGDSEVWEFYNFTADAHPMHVHEVAFHVINREGLVLDEASGEPLQPVKLNGNVRLPEPWENGLKDTVIAYPGEVTRIHAQFDSPGQFVWHCHIVEHEDNEMMRPYRIGPLQPGQPMPKIRLGKLMPKM